MTIKLQELKQLVELSKLLDDSNNKTEKKHSNLDDYFIGKYVICRSRNEGVLAGVVKDLDETGVILEDVRRFYYHKPKDTSVCWYEGIAKSGISSDSKLSTEVEKLIREDYSLTICSAEAEKSIRELKDHEQS